MPVEHAFLATEKQMICFSPYLGGKRFFIAGMARSYGGLCANVFFLGL